MHRGRNLGLTALAAVLLGLLYLYLDGGAPGELPAQAVESTPAYWMLYERDPSEFRNMTVTFASGESYRVRSDMVFQDGQLLGVQNTLGQPVVVEHQPGFALDVTGYQMMLLVAQHIPASCMNPSGACWALCCCTFSPGHSAGMTARPSCCI